MIRTVRTACPLDCYDSCSLKVTVEKGEIVSVFGDGDDPYTAGFVCPKARYQVDRTLAADRPVHPMKKVGGTWLRTTWDDALALLAAKIEEAAKDYGPSSVFYYYDSGSMGLLKTLGLRLFRTLGATEPLGSLCWAAGIQAQKYDFGGYLANVPEDILHSKIVIVWGRNPAVTNIHLVPLLREAREAGAHVVLIDVMNSASAPLADEVVHVAPGTDGALALAMANVVVSEGLVDVPYVAAYTCGLNPFREHLHRYTPEWAEGVTGVPSQDIRSLARRYGEARPAAILMGYGLQRYFTGGNTVRAIDALAALTGNIGRRGGGANYANGYIAGAITPLVPPESPGHPPRRIPRAMLSDVLQADPPVRVMVVAMSNVLNQSPGYEAARKAMRAIPFKAVLDLRWTETCEEADLFLPVTTPFEDEDVFFGSWHPMISYTEKCVPPKGEAKPDNDVWEALAERLGVPGFGRTRDEWVDYALRCASGGRLKAGDLKGRRVRFPGLPEVAWQDGHFRTLSGKFEFYSDAAEKATGNPMATYEGPESGHSQESAFPLRLISPRKINHLHSQFYEKTLSPEGLPYAYVSQRDLESSQLPSGSRARLESKEGCIEVMAVENRDVPRGIVVVFEGGSVLAGKGVNILTSEGETDMGHGPVYYDCFVRIAPVTECNCGGEGNRR